ncbi:uncharacterized protein BJ212DRAFT_1387782 [Suillus subaureus]|uniref:Secreted protein n=1 Tax=Suillus subaureus TaxID=48587 RepID=A0A9P7DZU6_9AGAM|nr:uncharacterized protein BJ212DRAFT_1387782 [Suillus subaureus]KAG1807333.1 hypothetical protein BJ212DRAFT_1387782 [Suillus subaureus]
MSAPIILLTSFVLLLLRLSQVSTFKPVCAVCNRSRMIPQYPNTPPLSDDFIPYSMIVPCSQKPATQSPFTFLTRRSLESPQTRVQCYVCIQ